MSSRKKTVQFTSPSFFFSPVFVIAGRIREALIYSKHRAQSLARRKSITGYKKVYPTNTENAIECFSSQNWIIWEPRLDYFRALNNKKKMATRIADLRYFFVLRLISLKKRGNWKSKCILSNASPYVRSWNYYSFIFFSVCFGTEKNENKRSNTRLLNNFEELIANVFLISPLWCGLSHIRI